MALCCGVSSHQRRAPSNRRVRCQPGLASLVFAHGSRARFLPAMQDMPDQGMSNRESYLPNEDRKTVFKDLVFVFFEAQQYNTYKEVVVRCVRVARVGIRRGLTSNCFCSAAQVSLICCMHAELLPSSSLQPLDLLHRIRTNRRSFTKH